MRELVERKEGRLGEDGVPYSKHELTKLIHYYDMLDVDNSGLLDFDEFYLLVCILLAVRVCISESLSIRIMRTGFSSIDMHDVIMNLQNFHN